MLWLVYEIYVDVFADDCRELPTGGGSNRGNIYQLISFDIGKAID
jgi:hypothetical protein